MKNLKSFYEINEGSSIRTYEDFCNEGWKDWVVSGALVASILSGSVFLGNKADDNYKKFLGRPIEIEKYEGVTTVKKIQELTSHGNSRNTIYVVFSVDKNGKVVKFQTKDLTFKVGDEIYVKMSQDEDKVRTYGTGNALTMSGEAYPSKDSSYVKNPELRSKIQDDRGMK